MSEKHENPYQRGDYREIFGVMKKLQVFAASTIRAAGRKLGKTAKAAIHTATVLMSPRETSERGDCRGSFSAMGHLYYMEKLPRKTVGGVREEQKYRLRWRQVALPPRIRGERVEAIKHPAEIKEAVTA